MRNRTMEKWILHAKKVNIFSNICSISANFSRYLPCSIYMKIINNSDFWRYVYESWYKLYVLVIKILRKYLLSNLLHFRMAAI